MSNSSYKAWVSTEAKAALDRLKKPGEGYEKDSEELGMKLTAGFAEGKYVKNVRVITVELQPKAQLYYSIVYMCVKTLLVDKGARYDHTNFCDENSHFSLFFYFPGDEKL